MYFLAVELWRCVCPVKQEQACNSVDPGGLWECLHTGLDGFNKFNYFLDFNLNHQKLSNFLTPALELDC